MMPPAGTPVAIYARYSSSLQSPMSIEDQVALCRDYIQRHGWVEVGVYVDAERRGTTWVGRDGYFSMMADADRGKFSIVLTEDLDRLSRVPSGTHLVIEELEALDIVVCTVSSGIVDDVDVAFKAAQNSRYVRGLAEKVRRGQSGMVRRGLNAGSVAYGYRKKIMPNGERGHREIVPEEAAIVQRIFRMAAAGLSGLDISRQLNAESVPGPRGKPWQSSTLYGNKTSGTGILRNRLYIGVNEYGATTRKHNRAKGTVTIKVTSQDARTRSESPHLRIIDDELFETVQARLEAAGSLKVHERRRVEYPLTGLVYCGCCGSKYTTLQEKLGCKGRVQGVCDNRRRVAREVVEDTALAGIKSRLLKPELIEPFLAEYRAEVARAIQEHQQRVEGGAKRLAVLEEEKANLVAQMRKGILGEVLAEELARLEIERRNLQREIKGRPPEPAPILDAATVVARLEVLLDDLKTHLKGADENAVRARDILRSFIERIEIKPILLAKEHKRGIGPVRITVFGRLNALLGRAADGHETQSTSGTQMRQDLANLEFRYWVDFFGDDGTPDAQGFADLALISTALVESGVPVGRSALIDILAKADNVTPDYGRFQPLSDRVKAALAYLRAEGDARPIQGGLPSTSWVSNRLPLTDEQWRRRARNEAPISEPMPIPSISLGAPTADVVTISKKGRKPD